MRFVTMLMGVAVAASSTMAFAQSAPANAPTAGASAGAHYSTTATDIGTLLDDPAAKAILVKHLPEIATSDQIEMARNMTLSDVKQYAPDKVSDKALAEIDAELAKLPPKK